MRTKCHDDSVYKTFNGPKAPLSNLADIAVSINGVDSPNGEAALQAAKLRFIADYNNDNPERKATLLASADRVANTRNPLAARTFSMTEFIHKAEQAHWENHVEMSQYEICRSKIRSSRKVREELEDINGRILVQYDRKAGPNSKWSARIDETTDTLVGLNKLGEIWEKVFAEYNTSDQV